MLIVENLDSVQQSAIFNRLLSNISEYKKRDKTIIIHSVWSISMQKFPHDIVAPHVGKLVKGLANVSKAWSGSTTVLQETLFAIHR